MQCGSQGSCRGVLRARQRAVAGAFCVRGKELLQGPFCVRGKGKMVFGALHKKCAESFPSAHKQIKKEQRAQPSCIRRPVAVAQEK